MVTAKHLKIVVSRFTMLELLTGLFLYRSEADFDRIVAWTIDNVIREAFGKASIFHNEFTMKLNVAECYAFRTLMQLGHVRSDDAWVLSELADMECKTDRYCRDAEKALSLSNTRRESGFIEHLNVV